MPELSDRIMASLRRFAEAIADGRYLDAVETHVLPLPIIRPLGTIMLTTPQEAADDLCDLWAQWQSAGVVTLTPSIIGLRSFAYGVYLADIEWAFRDRQGAEVALIHTSYGFRQDGDTIGISAIFCHDEMFQRPMVGKSG